jgi:hypothetical protein
VRKDLTARFKKNKKKPIVIKEPVAEKPPPEFEFDHVMTPTLHYLSLKEKFSKKVADYNPLKNLTYYVDDKKEEVKKPMVSERLMNKNDIWKEIGELVEQTNDVNETVTAVMASGRYNMQALND